MSTWSNIGTIARREYLVRVRTRTFGFGTALLVLGVAVIAFLPLIIRQLDSTGATRVAVATQAGVDAGDIASRLEVLLTPPATPGAPATRPDFIVTVVDDIDAGRAAVVAGEHDALLVAGRAATGDLAFTLYTDDNRTGRTAELARQVTNAIAVADRLERLGIAPEDQAGLFAPAVFEVQWPDPDRTGPTQDTLAIVGQDMLAFGMTLLIYMIILMYGNWIAMSVVEEKSSRVMEVILNAATPLQLLAGKVFGVGAVAFTQYAAVVLAGVAALVLQGPVAGIVLGDPAAASGLPQGLTPAMLIAFGVYGVLGFLVYATLYAAAGSLVSRMEDVNAAVMPMTLLSTAGYMIGIYAAMGLLDIRAGWIAGLTQVPFLSPFMMLGRIAVGVASPLEIGLSIALLLATIAVALWVAARIYTVGVLLYGSRPGTRAIWKLLREGM
jgi:ABC-2 type transport system permease protein